MSKYPRKIVCIGDVHGRDGWKTIIDRESDADLFIFLGDYVSTHRRDVTAEMQLNTLLDILSYKEENPERVVLLRGNHDMQHLGYYWAECCSFFRDVETEMSKPELKDRYLRDTQWVYVYKDIIFSHAGITGRWFQDSGCERVDDINNLPPSELFAFRPCKMSDYYGISATQGPTWIRPQTLIEYALPGWTYVVGHTTVKGVINLKDAIKKQYDDPTELGLDIDKCPDVWLCDCDLKEYLVIEGDEFKIKTND